MHDCVIKRGDELVTVATAADREHYLHVDFPTYLSYAEGGQNWSTQDVFEQKMVDMLKHAMRLHLSLEGKMIDDVDELLRIYNRPIKDYLAYVRSSHNLKQLVWAWEQVKRDQKEQQDASMG